MPADGDCRNDREDIASSPPFQDHVRQDRTALLVESFSAADRVTPGKEGGVDQAADKRSQVEDSRIDPLPRKIVLVVEDDEAVSGLLLALLDERGYDAIAAFDGQSAIALARKHQPHLITLDLALPGSDGHDVLANLKADPRTSDIPIVVISAFTQILPAGERKKLAYLLGKPFDVSEVLDIVQATVGNPYV
jgi:CheY-like chemotaxis protein